jgi:nitrite reductase/ring-hydroxylating ferredoxin subunit/multimeric flavodoxin WrbA
MWIDLGPIRDFAARPLTRAVVSGEPVVVTHLNGVFGVLAGTCNHAGGPLAEGRLDGEYVVCPWHHWKFHCRTGLGEPGFEADAVPRYDVKVENAHLLVSPAPVTPRTYAEHPPQPLARPVVRAPGPIRVLGLSTTNMDLAYPRYSTSDALLAAAMEHAGTLGAETQTLRLAELAFRACEGYYSKSAHACTWPCSITQMDPDDQMERVYEAFVHWADVVLVATPIRWGSASSLYYKMVERLNCVQNQLTIANTVLIKHKVAAFIITGGQDNVQAVAGQMLGFFGEIGCVFPQFPYIAHSRGWSAEDMEQNVVEVQHSSELREGAEALAARSVEQARRLLNQAGVEHEMQRGGRKAHRMLPDPPESAAPAGV